MLQAASLSSNGIHVAPNGDVTIPQKFKHDYRLCVTETGDEMKMLYLQDRYDYLNQHLFGNTLRRPKFEIHGRSRSLAVWFRVYRLISVQRKIFRLPKDGQLLNTLAHEMAHQYVDEVLQVRGEDAHGPTWQSTMMSIGLPIDATFTGDKRELMTKTELETVEHIEKVKINSEKLLYRDGRITGPTVMRYVVPLKHIDEPVVIFPKWSYSDKIGECVLGHKLKNGVFVSSFNYSINVMVFPGPLKIRTPAYKQAQEYANRQA